MDQLKLNGIDVFDVLILSKANISWDSIHDCGLANKRSAFIIDVCLVWKVVKTQFIDTMNSFFNDRSYSIQFFVTCLLTKSGYRIEWILSSYMMVIELWLLNWYQNHLIQREYFKTNTKNWLKFIQKINKKYRKRIYNNNIYINLLVNHN